MEESRQIVPDPGKNWFEMNRFKLRMMVWHFEYIIVMILFLLLEFIEFLKIRMEIKNIENNLCFWRYLWRLRISLNNLNNKFVFLKIFTKIVEGVLSHQLKQFVENEVYAIGIVTSTWDRKVSIFLIWLWL